MLQYLRDKLNKAEMSHGEKPMEMRLFQTICLLTTVLSLFVILPQKLFQNLPMLMYVAILIFGIGAYLLYRQACRGRCHYISFYLLLLLVINITWFLSGGSHGSVAFYLFSLLTYTTVMFRGRTRLVLLGVSTANGLALYILEYYFPGWVTPLITVEGRLVNVNISSGNGRT